MDEELKRLGTSRESAARLARKAAEAEQFLGIHGVSVTAGTPTRADRLHRTDQLPRPVTEEIAEEFNRLFGRG